MPEKAKKILQTAERMFAAGRFHEVTLDDICKKAGVGKGTVYRYFQDKEDLYRQVLISGLEDLVTSAQAVGQEERDPGRGLRKLAQCVAGFFTEREALFKLMFSEQMRASGHKSRIREQWRAKDEKIAAVAADFIRKGMEEGRYQTRFSPQAAAKLFLGMLRVGLRNRNEMAGGKDWPVALVELFENGLLVRK